MSGAPAASRVLDDEAVADSEAALAETFTRSPVDPSVAVLDGYGARLSIDGRHLVAEDGFGPHRRTRRWALATHGLARVVVIAGAGMVTLDALRWATGAGVGIVVLDPSDGAVLATSGACLVDDPRLRRAQAFAPGTALGLRIAGYLIGAKLTAQRQVALKLEAHEAAATIAELLGTLEGAGSLDEVRQLEASAANVYWRAWEGVEVRFVRRDLARVPAHWLRFAGRRSAVNPATPRHATDPINAMVNYSYKVLEGEGRLGALALGIDPGMGVLHADMRGRDSMVLDLIEAGRPAVDAHILDLLRSHSFRRRDFDEDRRGVLRVLSPITHLLAEAAPIYARTLAPVVEHVAGMLGEASAYDLSVPTHLSGAKHKAAAARRVGAGVGEPLAPVGPNPGALPPRRAPRQRPVPVADHRPPVVCPGCGVTLPEASGRRRTQRTWCASCLPERRAEINGPMHAASLAHAERFAVVTGSRPTHTPEAQAARSSANAAQRNAEVAWGGPLGDETWWHQELQPRLATFTLPAIARVTGVSTSAASKWRAGRTVAHARHWSALAELVGVHLEADMLEAVGR